MKIKNLYIKKLFSFVLLTFFMLSSAYSQASQISFGKNRVQYKQFKWQFYDTENFRIYFYQGGQDIGKYTILSSEIQYQEISKIFDYQLANKLEIIVYQDISDMHQTNIGIKKDADNISGTVQLKNNKLFVYFNGNHQHLDEQIRKGIATLMINHLMVGGGFKGVLTGAFSGDMPSWFTNGIIQYISEGWPTEKQQIMKSGFDAGTFQNLQKLNNKERQLVGQSLVYYITQHYGKDALNNLIYLSRINRSAEDGIYYVCGKSSNAVLEDWYNYFKNEFAKQKNEGTNGDAIALKKKKAFAFNNVLISPDGKKIAYLSNYIGRWQLMVKNVLDDKTKVLRKGGFKTLTLETDASSPIVAWEPRGKKLTVIFEKKDVFYLQHFDAETLKPDGKPEALRKFQKVLDVAYAEDSRNLLLSVMQNGQVDIIKYYFQTGKSTPITNDFYDDLQPTFANINGRQGVLFVSNRPNDNLVSGRLDTILPNGNFNVFFYDFNNPIQKLSQITFTPLADESFPMQLNDSTYTFLSNQSGKNKQYAGTLTQQKVDDRIKYVYELDRNFGEIDSVIIDKEIALQDAIGPDAELKRIISQEVVPVYKLQGSNYLLNEQTYSITELSVAPYKNESIYLVDLLRHQEIVSVSTSDGSLTDYETSYAKMAMDQYEQNQRNQLPKDTNLVQKDTIQAIEMPKIKVVYQSKFDGWEQLSEAHKAFVENKSVASKQDEGTGYKFTRTRQYFLKLMTEDVSINLDNSLVVTNYQPFNPGSPVFQQPLLNTMFRMGVTDLFEDHKIHGGFRIPLAPFNLRNNEVYITYENYKKRWDKSLTYYRKNVNEDVNIQYTGIGLSTNGTLNTRTNIVESLWKYPFNQLNSMRFKFGFRNDRFIVKSTELLTLYTPNSSNNWLYGRAEYVHDNTIQIAPNICNGLRANVYFEFQKEIPTKEDSLFNQPIQKPVFNNSYLMLWGVDARYYQKVHKTIVWASRFAYSTSVGTKKMVYYLGGIEGMLNPQFNQNTIVNTNNNYAFQTIGVNMRGFMQNIRNGNSYALINTELRVPIITAFSRREISSDFLQSLQIVPFFDLGTAWEGISPFAKNNLAQEIRQNQGGSAIARINVYKKPIVFGTGVGVRMKLMGYFMRFDVGAGYDTGKFNKPRFQMAFGYDF